MKKEVLDNINERYTIMEDGSIFDTVNNYYLDYELWDNAVICDLEDTQGRLKTYNVASLVAEMFVPNPNNERYVTFKDGHPQNVQAENLVWCNSRKEFSPASLTPEQRSILRMRINDAIDNDDWETAKRLGNELDPMEDLRTRHMPRQYAELHFKNKVPVQFSVILEATDWNGNHLAYGSANELAEIFDVKLTTLRKRYSKGASPEDTVLFSVIALVPKNMANAIIEVYKDGKVINEGSYTRICLEYDIHFEDLSDLLYTNEGDKITYNGLEFKMHAGQKKIPVDFSKGV